MLEDSWSGLIGDIEEVDNGIGIDRRNKILGLIEIDLKKGIGGRELGIRLEIEILEGGLWDWRRIDEGMGKLMIIRGDGVVGIMIEKRRMIKIMGDEVEEGLDKEEDKRKKKERKEKVEKKESDGEKEKMRGVMGGIERRE